MTPVRFAILTLVSTLVLSAQVGFGRRAPRIAGEEGSPPAPRLGQLTEFLGLDDAQLEAITQVRSDYRNAVGENMKTIGEKRRQAFESLASDSPDATLIGQLLVEAKDLEDSVKGREGEFIAKIQAVLTDSQKAQLATLEKMAPYQTEIREGQSLGLLPGEDGEVHLQGGGPGGPRGPMGPTPGGPGFAR
jgi:uncharacterized membrane protein